MNKDEFINEVKKLGVFLTKDQLNKLDSFYNLLILWNERINLTTITDYNKVYLKHFYDSLTLIKEIDLTKDLKICDVGSGAGFPGIVLKICFPNLNIVLIDSLQKRVNYLNEIIKELDLNNITAIHSRMEEYSKAHEEEFDIITARAVANLNTLLEISIKALKIKGHLLLMKANCDDEILNSARALTELNGEICNINKFQLPIENSNRTIINIVKNGRTNSKYPRNIDKIKKSPL